MTEIEDNFLLLKDLFPESWNENPEFSKYINELCSYGITRLYNEPVNLAEERSQILSETQKLAFNNYKTFIQTADCSKEVFQDFQIVENHLDNMLIKLPKLQKAYSIFISEASQINLNRKLNTTTLLKHPKLLEILELSQLMDTCVRNSHYDDALELAEYSRRLAKRHSSISVICKIVDEIKLSMDVMLRQLLGQLKQDLQLPKCLSVIGYLRRINVFTEIELRLKFLQIRSEWFQNTLKSIPNDDPYHHISKTIELSRVHLFDIVTQYRAIFSDEEFSFLKDAEGDNSVLFYTWIVQKISEFLETLEIDINRGVGNRLDSLLGQCMYFGLSFGRVGLDFRNLMVPIFHNAVQNMLTVSVTTAEQKLEESLKIYSLLGGSVNSSSFILPNQPVNNLQAPGVLMEFSPLAIYCNDLLLAFNDLRLCMPLSLATQVARILQKSLSNLSSFLLTFHRVDESTFNTKELELFTRLCGLFANEFLPFMNRCLNQLFPSSQLAQVAGISIADVSKTIVGMLDIEKIIAPIKHLIPLPKLTEPIILDSNINENVNMKPFNTELNIQSVRDQNTDDINSLSKSKEDKINDNDSYLNLAINKDAPSEIKDDNLLPKLEINENNLLLSSNTIYLQEMPLNNFSVNILSKIEDSIDTKLDINLPINKIKETTANNLEKILDINIYTSSEIKDGNLLLSSNIYPQEQKLYNSEDILKKNDLIDIKKDDLTDTKLDIDISDKIIKETNGLDISQKNDASVDVSNNNNNNLNATPIVPIDDQTEKVLNNLRVESF